MAEKAGKNLLLKVESPAGSGTYATLGALQTKEMQIERDNIEVTNHGSNDWQEFLTGAGVRKVSFSANGISDGDATLEILEDAVFDGTNILCKFIQDDGSGTPEKTYAGSFKVTSYTRGGEHNGAQTWSASFVSNGAVTVT